MEGPKKKEFKKPISSKEEKFIEEEDNKKSIILIIVAIIAVLGLIFASVFLFNDDKKGNKDNDIDVVIPDEEDEEDLVDKVTSKTVAEAETYKVIYLDRDAKQIGETQEVLNLGDRIDEKAPIVPGYRFQEWAGFYDEANDIYYYVPIYKQNVERIPAAEEPYLDEEDSNAEDTYEVAITKVEEPTGKVTTYDEAGKATVTTADEEDVVESPTYTVEVTGTVEELEDEEIDDQVSIDEQYNHIIALRFNAPEGTTAENIAKMTVKVSATADDELSSDQYYYKGEEGATGRDMLDSTDEEFAAGEYYFYYYQEVDTKTNTTVEVYWGNDPAEDLTAIPPVTAEPEYTEVYNLDVSGVITEELPE